MARQTITPGSAPILWSTVDDAFEKINNNFTELYLSIGGDAVDLTSLGSSVIPSVNVTYDLGSNTKRWRDLYLSGDTIFLGNALISSTGSAVNLPSGSTIGNTVLDQAYFKTISVAGQGNIVADAGGTAVLTIATSVGISATTNPASDTLTLSNTGVTSAISGAGIGISSGTGAVTITNTGVVTATAGTGINISGTSNLTISNAGVVSVITDPGSGISLDTSVPGIVRISNSAPFTPQNTFQNIAVPGPTTIQADSTSDTLTFQNGSGISISGNATSDTISITNTGVTALAVTGSGLSVSGSSGSVNISNTGVVAISAGDGIGINTSTGTVVVSNTRFGFTSIAVTGQNSLLADNTTDTLTLIAGEGITLTTNNTVDSLKIDVSFLVGNVFSDSSTLLVDSVNSQIVGNINTSILRTNETKIALGSSAGSTNQGPSGVAIGWVSGSINQGDSGIAIGVSAGFGDQGSDAVAMGAAAGYVTQGNKAIAIGSAAGYTTQGVAAISIGDAAGYTAQGSSAIAIGPGAGNGNQGPLSIAIGSNAGNSNQPQNSIIISATGGILNAVTDGLFIAPIREVTGPQTLYYNPVNSEITWGPVPSGGTSGGAASDYTFSVAGDDSTQRVINNGETLQFIGVSGITTTTDGEGKVTITGPTLATVATSGSYNDLSNQPSIPSLGNITFVSTTIDSSDSSGIVFTPVVTFNSDITVENELTVGNSATVAGTLTVNNLNVIGAITSQGSGTPEIFSDNEVLLTAGTRVEITSSPLKMASFTTAGRDTLSAINGDVIYNTTLNKFQGYANGTWVDFH
jgi:hypothetical protein